MMMFSKGNNYQPWMDEVVLTSTHNLWFGAEIRKNNIYPYKAQFSIYKVGITGVFIT